MEITVKEFQYVDLIAISGRVDSVVASRLAQALEAANDRGKYKIVIDMSQLEHMSSAGFRALGDAQRNSKRHNGGEVMLTQVPENIREALDLVGFTEYFRIFDSVTSAFEYADNLPADDSTTTSPLPSTEN